MMHFTEDQLINLLEMTAWRMQPPQLFSMFHISASVITAAVAAWLASILSKHFRTGYLVCAGWILIVLEIYKQLFIFFVTGNGNYDWWYFPFQLCSVPMYMCIILPLLRGSAKRAILAFMADYTLISAAAALIYPEDFLRSYVTLTAHGFIWHGILLFISLLIIMSGACEGSYRDFLSATIVFSVLSLIAAGINAACEPVMQAGNTAHSYAAMFYLNPYHISPQIIVGRVQHLAGIPAGLILYSAAIVMAAGIVELSRHSKKTSF
jgi:hypothetical protein